MGINNLAASVSKLAEMGFETVLAVEFRSRCLKINPVIKSAASGRRVWGLPCILVIGEAARAADLITGLIFKYFERNLAILANLWSR